MKDYYAILGISINAESEVISAAYKALAKKYHPDVYKGIPSINLIYNTS